MLPVLLVLVLPVLLPPVLLTGFFNIDSNSAEEIFTFEFETEDLAPPLAAEAKLPTKPIREIRERKVFFTKGSRHFFVV